MKKQIHEICISHEGHDFALALVGSIESDRIDIDNLYLKYGKVDVYKIFHERKIVNCEFKIDAQEKQSVRCMICSITEFSAGERYSMELVIVGV